MCGDLTPNSSLSIDVGVRIPISALNYSMTVWLILGFTPLNAPFEGGILVPNPDVLKAFALDTTMQDTGVSLGINWPAGIGAGTDFWMQAWVPFSDGGSVSGTLASNAVMFTAQ
jgi:hypothetical protein